MKLFASAFLSAAIAAAAMPQDASGGPNGHLLGDSLLILSPAVSRGFDFPGIFGVLRVDLASAIVVAVDENRTDVIDLLDRLGPATRGTFWFQVLRADEAGYHLSTARRIGDEARLRFRQQHGEVASRARAEACIDEAAGTDMAEGWRRGARIVDVRPLFRPDVTGVAYFEYAVDQGGFVVVATGDHDVPIPNWSSVGLSPCEHLSREAARQGRQVARFLRIDAMGYAAEDGAGQLIAQRGEPLQQLHDLPIGPSASGTAPLTRPWPSWRALKAGYAETYRPIRHQRHLDAADRWAAESEGGSAELLSSWSSWTTYVADGGSGEQPRYGQFTYGGCAVGCGPVAWAILFAWGDRQAHAGNPSWTGRTGLYRDGGGTTASGASVSAVAPLYQSEDSGIDDVIRELNGLMDTKCVLGGGLTTPWRMDDAQGYLDLRTSASVTTAYNSLSIAESRLREMARDSIKDRDTPVVIGNSMGGAKHYPVAFRYRWRSKHTLFGTKYDREFYVNPGWGSSAEFQWVDAQTWFCGELHR